ncbi:Adenylyl-sulfate kinase [Burkholderia sp. 8Y]|uniref:adenylyl-sulfate kinase n=1 Tax=Burkholderia sp. 8Y TaxID=2653133 RepID=UPI0012F1A4B6|nr:adenylyl-sulfate kinase [Burkholderia sp. 8Y]VXC34581.1 Adenylyl-sulfate kinase [Burkholderia sp. 8Y]
MHDLPIKEHRNRYGHPGAIIWLTGLSGAGKSTLSHNLERRLFERGYFVTALDGDELREDLNADLGFSASDRTENVRRVAAVARFMANRGALVIVSLISPFEEDRQRARAASHVPFRLVHVDASLDVCQRRDPKGFYARVAKGGIQQFTGVTSPYEPPLSPDLLLNTGELSIAACIDRLVRLVEEAAPLEHRTPQEH